LKKRKKSKTGRNNLGKQPRKQKKKNTASVRKNISKGCDQETEKKNHQSILSIKKFQILPSFKGESKFYCTENLFLL